MLVKYKTFFCCATFLYDYFQKKLSIIYLGSYSFRCMGEPNNLVKYTSQCMQFRSWSQISFTATFFCKYDRLIFYLVQSPPGPLKESQPEKIESNAIYIYTYDRKTFDAGQSFALSICCGTDNIREHVFIPCDFFLSTRQKWKVEYFIGPVAG